MKRKIMGIMGNKIFRFTIAQYFTNSPISSTAVCGNQSYSLSIVNGMRKKLWGIKYLDLPSPNICYKFVDSKTTRLAEW
jgi:hypothetical protein